MTVAPAHAGASVSLWRYLNAPDRRRRIRPGERGQLRERGGLPGLCSRPWPGLRRRGCGTEAALRNATLYLDGEYTYRGERATDIQALEWPRTVATGVPREVVNACCELAARALKSPLWQDVSGTTVGAAIEKTVGPITTKYANAAGARNDGQTRYAGVTAMLRRWLSSYGSSVKLVRC